MILSPKHRILLVLIWNETFFKGTWAKQKRFLVVKFEVPRIRTWSTCTKWTLPARGIKFLSLVVPVQKISLH